MPDGNDSDDQENSHSADESEEAPRERRMKDKRERDLEMPKQTQISGEDNAVALECVVEEVSTSSQNMISELPADNVQTKYTNEVSCGSISE